MNPSHAGVPATDPTRPVLPGWSAALSALWSMTWRSVWSPRRWPVLALLILASPVLAWLRLQTGELDPRPDWLDWVSRFHFGLVIPLWCLLAFGSFVRDEVQAGTIGFLLTRPLTRTRFLLVRWLCTLAVVQVPLALTTVLLGVTAIILGIPDGLKLTVLLLGAQFAVVPAYGAIAAFLGLLTRKYVLIGLVYGFVVEIGIGQIPTNINTLSVARHFRTLLAQSDAWAQGMTWSMRAVGESVGVLLLLMLAYLAASTLLFNLREYSQSEENKQ